MTGFVFVQGVTGFVRVPGELSSTGCLKEVLERFRQGFASNIGVAMVRRSPLLWGSVYTLHPKSLFKISRPLHHWMWQGCSRSQKVGTSISSRP